MKKKRDQVQPNKLNHTNLNENNKMNMEVHNLKVNVCFSCPVDLIGCVQHLPHMRTPSVPQISP
jgi:hypothetical protein